MKAHTCLSDDDFYLPYFVRIRMHTVETNIQRNKRIVKVIDLTFRSLL